MSPMAAIPVSARAMPEKYGPEHHRGADYAVIPLAVAVIPHLINCIDYRYNGNEEKQKHNNADYPSALIAVAGGNL